ncbi:MAG: hypothetical protein RR198_02595 [Oscillospiraceae bacterium]
MGHLFMDGGQSGRYLNFCEAIVNCASLGISSKWIFYGQRSKRSLPQLL